MYNLRQHYHPIHLQHWWYSLQHWSFLLVPVTTPPLKIRTMWKRKLPTTSSTTQTVNHPLWHHSWKRNQEIQLLLLGKYSSAQGTLPCLLPGSLSVHHLPQSGVSKRHKQKLSRTLRKECSWRYSVDGLDALGRYSVRKILPVIQPRVLKEFHLFITRTKLKISYKPSLHHEGHYGDGETFMNS